MTTSPAATRHDNAETGQLTRREMAKYALAVFVVLRIVATVVPALAVASGIDVEAVALEGRDMLGEPSLDSGVAGHLLGPWQRQDALRYFRIARDGYETAGDSVFPPLYPMLIRAVAWPLGGDGQARVIAGLLLSNVAAVAGFYFLLRLVNQHLNATLARRSLLTLAVFPTSFFFVAAYSESIFLCCTMAALLRNDEGKHLQAGLFGFLAALTRLTGWVVAIPMLWGVWVNRKQIREQGTSALLGRFGSAGLPMVAAAGFIGYRSLAGLPPIASVYRDDWSTTTSWPGKALLRAFGWIVTGTVPGEYGISFWLDVFAMSMAVAACIWGWKNLPRAWWLYTLAATLFVLLPDSPPRTVNSTSRYVLVIFPVFMMLSQLRAPALRRILAAMGLLLGLAFLWVSTNLYWVA